MEIRWLRAALRNLEDQVDYIAARNPYAAERASDRLHAVVSRLADHPQMGRIGRVDGTRELIVSGTPWVVIYRLTDAIEILRVLHGAQSWPPRR
jgi:toxin ParE1/3/4